MKVIFLDIDGVLNSSEYFASDAYRTASEQESMSMRREWSREIDPNAVALLNELVSATGAEVVISSSWRIVREDQEIEHDLRLRGYSGRHLLGHTTCRRTGMRGNEIAAWLRGRDVEAFVILDDDSDMADLGDHLVQTTFAHGLQPEHFALAKAMLSTKPA